MNLNRLLPTASALSRYVGADTRNRWRSATWFQAYKAVWAGGLSAARLRLYREARKRLKELLR